MCLQIDGKPKERGHYQKIPSLWELEYFKAVLDSVVYIYEN